MSPSAFLLDDEPLAVKRLARMLEATGRVRIVGSSNDPVEAEAQLQGFDPPVDVLFVDIEMPGLTGFELIARLSEPQPLVVFTTAYSQYALQAFEAQAIDYLLKPVDAQHLDRALSKMERMLGQPKPDLGDLAAKVAKILGAPAPAAFPARIPSRTGDKIELVEVAKVTHFYALDKLTFAATPQKDHAIEYTIQDLERGLDPARWVRIHRSTIVNIESILELHTWFGGKVLLRLNDGKKTELPVSRERVKDLKDRIGLV